MKYVIAVDAEGPAGVVGEPGKEYKSPALTLNKPGTYYLEVLVWLKKPVIDGWDAGSDWPIDYYEGTISDFTITITKY